MSRPNPADLKENSQPRRMSSQRFPLLSAELRERFLWLLAPASRPITCYPESFKLMDFEHSLLQLPTLANQPDFQRFHEIRQQTINLMKEMKIPEIRVFFFAFKTPIDPANWVTDYPKSELDIASPRALDNELMRYFNANPPFPRDAGRHPRQYKFHLIVPLTERDDYYNAKESWREEKVDVADIDLTTVREQFIQEDNRNAFNFLLNETPGAFPENLFLLEAASVHIDATILEVLKRQIKEKRSEIFVSIGLHCFNGVDRSGFLAAYYCMTRTNRDADVHKSFILARKAGLEVVEKAYQDNWIRFSKYWTRGLNIPRGQHESFVDHLEEVKKDPKYVQKHSCQYSGAVRSLQDVSRELINRHYRAIGRVPPANAPLLPVIVERQSKSVLQTSARAQKSHAHQLSNGEIKTEEKIVKSGNAMAVEPTAVTAISDRKPVVVKTEEIYAPAGSEDIQSDNLDETDAKEALKDSELISDGPFRTLKEDYGGIYSILADDGSLINAVDYLIQLIKALDNILEEAIKKEREDTQRHTNFLIPLPIMTRQRHELLSIMKELEGVTKSVEISMLGNSRTGKSTTLDLLCQRSVQSINSIKEIFQLVKEVSERKTQEEGDDQRIGINSRPVIPRHFLAPEFKLDGEPDRLEYRILNDNLTQPLSRSSSARPSINRGSLNGGRIVLDSNPNTEESASQPEEKLNLGSELRWNFGPPNYALSERERKAFNRTGQNLPIPMLLPSRVGGESSTAVRTELRFHNISRPDELPFELILAGISMKDATTAMDYIKTLVDSEATEADNPLLYQRGLGLIGQSFRLTPPEFRALAKANPDDFFQIPGFFKDVIGREIFFNPTLDYFNQRADIFQGREIDSISDSDLQNGIQKIASSIYELQCNLLAGKHFGAFSSNTLFAPLPALRHGGALVDNGGVKRDDTLKTSRLYSSLVNSTGFIIFFDDKGAFDQELLGFLVKVMVGWLGKIVREVKRLEFLDVERQEALKEILANRFEIICTIVFGYRIKDVDALLPVYVEMYRAVKQLIKMAMARLIKEQTFANNGEEDEELVEILEELRPLLLPDVSDPELWNSGTHLTGTQHGQFLFQCIQPTAPEWDETSGMPQFCRWIERISASRATVSLMPLLKNLKSIINNIYRSMEYCEHLTQLEPSQQALVAAEVQRLRPENLQNILQPDFDEALGQFRKINIVDDIVKPILKTLKGQSNELQKLKEAPDQPPKERIPETVYFFDKKEVKTLMENYYKSIMQTIGKNLPNLQQPREVKDSSKQVNIKTRSSMKESRSSSAPISQVDAEIPLRQLFRQEFDHILSGFSDLRNRLGNAFGPEQINKIASMTVKKYRQNPRQPANKPLAQLTKDERAIRTLGDGILENMQNVLESQLRSELTRAWSFGLSASVGHLNAQFYRSIEACEEKFFAALNTIVLDYFDDEEEEEDNPMAENLLFESIKNAICKGFGGNYYQASLRQLMNHTITQLKGIINTCCKELINAASLSRLITLESEQFKEIQDLSAFQRRTASFQQFTGRICDHAKIINAFLVGEEKGEETTDHKENNVESRANNQATPVRPQRPVPNSASPAAPNSQNFSVPNNRTNSVLAQRGPIASRQTRPLKKKCDNWKFEAFTKLSNFLKACYKDYDQLPEELLTLSKGKKKEFTDYQTRLRTSLVKEFDNGIFHMNEKSIAVHAQQTYSRFYNQYGRKHKNAMREFFKFFDNPNNAENIDNGHVELPIRRDQNSQKGKLVVEQFMIGAIRYRMNVDKQTIVTEALNSFAPDGRIDWPKLQAVSVKISPYKEKNEKTLEQYLGARLRITKARTPSVLRDLVNAEEEKDKFSDILSGEQPPPGQGGFQPQPLIGNFSPRKDQEKNSSSPAPRELMETQLSIAYDKLLEIERKLKDTKQKRQKSNKRKRSDEEEKIPLEENRDSIIDGEMIESNKKAKSYHKNREIVIIDDDEELVESSAAPTAPPSPARMQLRVRNRPAACLRPASIRESAKQARIQIRQAIRAAEAEFEGEFEIDEQDKNPPERMEEEEIDEETDVTDSETEDSETDDSEVEYSFL